MNPDGPLDAIPLAVAYLGAWFALAGVVYCFIGAETRGKSIEQLDKELAATA